MFNITNYYKNAHPNYDAVLSNAWRRQWHPTPVLLPGEPHGWRSLVGCSPWGSEEWDTTEQLHFDFSPSCIGEGNGKPLQYSCQENPWDGGAWWAAVYGVAQSLAPLKQLRSSSSSRSMMKNQCPHFKYFILFNFTILYWFCHMSKWICHRYTCVPHPEPSSLLPPHTIPLGRHSAPSCIFSHYSELLLKGAYKGI